MPLYLNYQAFDHACLVQGLDLNMAAKELGVTRATLRNYRECGYPVPRKAIDKIKEFMGKAAKTSGFPPVDDGMYGPWAIFYPQPVMGETFPRARLNDPQALNAELQRVISMYPPAERGVELAAYGLTYPRVLYCVRSRSTSIPTAYNIAQWLKKPVADMFSLSYRKRGA